MADFHEALKSLHTAEKTSDLLYTGADDNPGVHFPLSPLQSVRRGDSNLQLSRPNEWRPWTVDFPASTPLEYRRNQHLSVRIFSSLKLVHKR